MMHRLFFLLVCMSLSLPTKAQGLSLATGELEAYHQRHLKIQKGTLWALSGWAVANIGVGLVLRSQTEGTERYFHEMNAGWNLVNLGIALPGLIQAYADKDGVPERAEALKRQHSIEQVLMLNIGLNTAYMASGAFLIERSRRSDTSIRPERLKGYGQGLILQGGFLLLFDITQYLIYRANGKRFAPALLGQVGLAPGGVRLSWTF